MTPRFAVNHVIAYGQSLSSGWEGWPALSTAPRGDSLMLGRSVRPVDENRAEWRPVGGAGFHRLAATVQERESGALLSPAQVAGLPARALALGETVLESAVGHWRARMLAEDPGAAAHRLLASSCGVGGRGLAALSRGARPELFARLRQCVALARATAAAQGLDYGVAALLFLQGEQDSGDGMATAEYGALLRRWHDDALAELAPDQPPPALFLSQTGGTYANDAHSVGMAQLEHALSRPGVFMVGPSYPVPDKAGHLDPNGYRWLGAQFGKVMHRVLSQGQGWRPLHPLGAAQVGGAVLARFHVPVPPLAWGRPFRRQTLAAPRDRGFTLVDAAGVVEIAEVALAAPDAVAIRPVRPPGPGLRLRYADQSRHGGYGALHDSDPAVADTAYEYDALAGHQPAAAHADWIGRRYPLMNWCVGFDIPVAGG